MFNEPMTDAEIAEAEKLCEAATPEAACGTINDAGYKKLLTEEDARFCVCARTGWPRALAEVIRERQRLRNVTALLTAAYALLSKNTVGSAWIDWKMQVQGVLGPGLYRRGGKVYDLTGEVRTDEEIAALTSHLPRVIMKKKGPSP